MKTNNNKAFTLIEVVLTVAILSMLMFIVYSLFSMSSKPHAIVTREYVLQSNVRLASQKLTSLIKKSTAIFAYKDVEPIFTQGIFPESGGSNELILIDETFVNNSPKKTELIAAMDKYKGWSFIALGSGGRELREFVYHKDPATGKGYYTLQRILEKQSIGTSDIVYEIEYKKKNPYTEDNLLEYSLTGKLSGGASGSEPINIKSEVEALSTLQVVDKGDYTKRATALFYRTEERPMGVDAEAAVAMVLDISGSMGDDMGGNSGGSNNPNAPNASRISILRQKAGDLIDKMSSLENINVNLIPFSNSSNLPNVWKNYKYNGVTKDPKAWKNAKNDNGELNDLIGKLVSTNGTNVGDGIRRAYYRFNGYGKQDANKYMILLMDGVPTFGSVHKASRDRPGFSNYVGDIRIHNGENYYYDGRSWFFGYTYYYLRYYNIEFVTSDIEISESEYSYDGSRKPDGRYAGRGNASDDYISKDYITEMAKKLGDIKNSKGEKNLKVYVIGFSNVPEERAELDFIKGELAKYTKEVTAYEVTDAEGLETVFTGINQIILDDLWHITGPKE